MYGSVFLDGTTAQINTSMLVMDYWTSFTTSLQPNDGKGTVPSEFHDTTTVYSCLHTLFPQRRTGNRTIFGIP